MKKGVCIFLLLFGLLNTKVYAEDMVTITFYDDRGNVVEVQEVAYGQRFTIPTVSKDGYNFLGYNTQPDGSGRTLQSNIATQSISYYPVFQAFLYTVSYYVDTVIVHQEQIAYGEDASAIIPPEKEGYDFIGWGDLQNITSNRNVYAEYQLQNRVLTFKQIEVKENNKEVQKNEETKNIKEKTQKQQKKEETKETKNNLILVGSFIVFFSISLLLLIRKK